ncbi:MAG: ABC transporter ATP-binding protein [Planctomycetes bacterium]|nr:ABC transporter ATP-binding protein [Planctomycetota bacterium]
MSRPTQHDTLTPSDLDRPAPPIVVDVQSVHKVYGSGESAYEALLGVDLAVPRGEFVAIMGPSGSGKSTLLHLMGGIDTPSQGRVMLENIDMATLDDDRRTILRRKRIGFVFQSFNLLPSLTAEENVALPLLLDGVPRAEINRRVETMLQRVGVAHRRANLPSQMSGGEQQRVALARALVIEPAVLMADEPTGNLDSAKGQQITALLRRLVDEHDQTIVMVTHDPNVAQQADRLVRLRDGQIESDERVGATQTFAASG